MNTKRMFLFLIGCIGTRSLLVYLAKTLSPLYLQIMGALALIPAIGMLYIYMFGLRKTGPEVFGEQIWWNDLRPVHGLLYLCFGITALLKYKNAWIFLLADVIIGLTAFLLHHYT